jgi:drug/metabolite transporter (DMT)-like permease
MDLRTAFLILTCVTLSAVAQITLKFGVSSERITADLAADDYWSAISSVATTPAILVGLTLYFVSALLWLLVLAKIDVTQAYPFIGLSFLITMVFGNLLLDEIISSGRVVGTFLVVIGVFLVARS